MTWIPPQPRTDLIRLGIDLDGTLCESTWSVRNPDAKPGDPIAKNVAKLLKCKEQGWKIWIHTARANAEYEIIESWLNHHKIPFDGIETGKPLFYKYCDDRAIHESAPNWSDGCHCETCTCNER